MILPTDVRNKISRKELRKKLQSKSRQFEKIKIYNIVYHETFNDNDLTVFNAINLEDVIFENCFLDCIRFSHSIFKNVLFEHCEIVNGNFRNCQINSSSFKDCCMNYIDFSGSVLNCVNFKQNKSFSANFKNSQLQSVNFKNCNLECSNFDLSEENNTEFRSSNLNKSSFKNVRFQDVNIIQCDLHSTDFSQSTGLLNPIDYLSENFEWNDQGMIVYKIFDHFMPTVWSYLKKPGDILTEETNCDRTMLGCGINVANQFWFQDQKQKGIFQGIMLYYSQDVWKCLIKFQWLPGVVVPYVPLGQIRCCKIQLIKKLTELDLFNFYSGKEKMIYNNDF